MLSASQRTDIVDSFRLVVPIAETAAELFYRRLFELKPEYRALFSDDMQSQRAKLIKMLAFIVGSLDYKDSEWDQSVDADRDLMMVVLAMGRRHSELYKIPDDSYGPVAEALLWALAQGLGDAFTPRVRDAWVAVYTSLATTMKMGSRSALDMNHGKVS